MINTHLRNSTFYNYYYYYFTQSVHVQQRKKKKKINSLITLFVSVSAKSTHKQIFSVHVMYFYNILHELRQLLNASPPDHININ